MKSKNLALITGASSGIGEALLRELVQRGWSVIGMALKTNLQPFKKSLEIHLRQLYATYHRNQK